jgi:hypothetical protein
MLERRSVLMRETNIPDGAAARFAAYYAVMRTVLIIRYIIGAVFNPPCRWLLGWHVIGYMFSALCNFPSFPIFCSMGIIDSLEYWTLTTFPIYFLGSCNVN